MLTLLTIAVSILAFFKLIEVALVFLAVRQGPADADAQKSSEQELRPADQPTCGAGTTCLQETKIEPDRSWIEDRLDEYDDVIAGMRRQLPSMRGLEYAVSARQLVAMLAARDRLQLIACGDLEGAHALVDKLHDIDITAHPR